MPVYTRIFFGLDGMDREAERHFLTSFYNKPGHFCGILYLRRSYESYELAVKSRQIDVN